MDTTSHHTTVDQVERLNQSIDNFLDALSDYFMMKIGLIDFTLRNSITIIASIHLPVNHLS